MDKPYYLIKTSSGKAGYLFDRRVFTDKESLPMRKRLENSGCVIKKISQTERDEVLNTEEDWQIF